ncbi:MAG: ankyrin repeat domain-containing protein [Spirochaetales bacterium]|nr:ankyrin repeat domain-containing protein [Spirochaetales bacterium]
MDIFNAIKSNDTLFVREYIKGQGDINVRDSYNMTPLILAADQGRLEIVKLLLESTADINAQDKMGQTALHLAAGRNFTSIIKLLLQAKASLNIKARNGLRAYQFATENGMREAAVILKKAMG